MDILRKKPPSKQQMLERLQFSRNLPVALKAAELLSGKLTEDHKFGAFLTAVLEDKYDQAIMRADPFNRAALIAQDCVIGKFRFQAPDKDGYTSGVEYYLQVRTQLGVFSVTPSIVHPCDILIYFSLKEFLYDFNII